MKTPAAETRTTTPTPQAAALAKRFGDAALPTGKPGGKFLQALQAAPAVKMPTAEPTPKLAWANVLPPAGAKSPELPVAELPRTFTPIDAPVQSPAERPLLRMPDEPAELTLTVAPTDPALGQLAQTHPELAGLAGRVAAGEPPTLRRTVRVGRDANGAVTLTLDLATDANTATPIRMTQVDPDTVAISIAHAGRLTPNQLADLMARLRSAAGDTSVLFVPNRPAVTHG
ncbi:MAG: hypothetical protein AAF656_09790 [Planctomycetota bacterium]